MGLFGYAFVIFNQQLMISDDQTESALDSELSLLWSHDYPKTRWVPNSLEWRSQAASHGHLAPAVPPALMVTRLDGPSLDIVHNIILTSIKVEAQGLHGQVAIDARGKTGNDPYAEYDQKLRDLGDLLTKKTTLKVTLDNKDALIAPHSLSEIAVYCGWYSLENFSSPGTFKQGRRRVPYCQPGVRQPAAAKGAWLGPRPVKRGRDRNPRPGRRALPSILPPARRILPAPDDRQSHPGRGVLAHAPMVQLDAALHRRPAL